MPLESLHDENINIHDLTIEEKKEPESQALKHYEILKKSSLYDAEGKEWNCSIDEEGTRKTLGRASEDQLFGILVESQFNQTSAYDLYTELKETPLYIRRLEEWRTAIDEARRPADDPNRYSKNNLLGVLVEAQFDKKSALKLFENLKETRYYDKWKDQWIQSIDRSGSTNSDNREASAQLLSILIEALSDKKFAEEKYRKLQDTKLYDKRKKQWNYSINERQELQNNDRYTEDQLLGILTEAQFDKTSAKILYEDLKKTKLYNFKLKMWENFMDKNQTLQYFNEFYSRDQLLNILCEREFEDKKLESDSATPPLPEERKY